MLNDVVDTRLDFDQAELVKLLQDSSVTDLRRFSSLVCSWVVKDAAPELPQASVALSLLESGRFGDSPERSELARVVEELDETAWDIQEKVDEGVESDDAYAIAFGRARAMNAVWFALESDPLFATCEALYEAQAALGKPDEMADLVRNAL